MAKETYFEDPPSGHVAKLGYDSVNDRWKAEAVDASGLAQVDIADVADRQVNVHGYDGSAWRKQPLVWGYSGDITDSTVDTDADAGSNNLDFGPVPSDEVWVLQSAAGMDTDNAPSSILVQIISGIYTSTIFPDYAPVAFQWSVWSGEHVVPPGGTVRVRLNGCTAGDDIYAGIGGYKMNIAQ